MAMHAEVGPWRSGCACHRAHGEHAEQARLTTALVAALEQALCTARKLPAELERGGHGSTTAYTRTEPAPSNLRPDLHWATGRVAEIDRALAEARVAFARLGAILALAHADQIAATLTPVPTECDYPRGLTAREIEVLRLVAVGRANHEIAAQLCISPNTVLRHVSNIFTKTGVANRAAAAVFALRHGLADPSDARP